MKNIVTTIVILYRPSDLSIRSWVGYGKNASLIIVDNTPLNEICYNIPDNIKYIQLGENKGIAYAQNIGIASALYDGADYLLFFDQDSVVEFDYHIKILREYERISSILLPQKDKIGILGPAVINRSTGHPYLSDKTHPIGENVFKVQNLISSGSIINRNTLNDVGGMDEKLFIDLVDHEWCWRALSKGYICCQTYRLEIDHQVGSDVIRLLGFTYIKSAPLRFFYQYRNTLMLIKRNYVPFRWKLNTIIKRTIFILGLYFIKDYSKEEKKSIIKYVWKGVKEGL